MEITQEIKFGTKWSWSGSAEPLGSVEPGLPSFQPNFDHVQGNILRGDPSIDDCYRLVLGLGFLQIDEVYDMTHV